MIETDLAFRLKNTAAELKHLKVRIARATERALKTVKEHEEWVIQVEGQMAVME